ncbi:hypothetical protein HANVADRAFT_54167 [Hanseniaspora valbyensis NRRL Y-1626]|uniref:Uncharacterized protein n=1 Tax=Hanseniaspora valbyensis NRRL Y-1626 TaxID=766949 RepID=A0A1B7T8I7_9ASCO|nr:hypothetical protein HANVADRAFT_54167 [Hanseniaspora valbyensis NRRL Y-1626]
MHNSKEFNCFASEENYLIDPEEVSTPLNQIIDPNTLDINNDLYEKRSLLLNHSNDCVENEDAEYYGNNNTYQNTDALKNPISPLTHKTSNQNNEIDLYSQFIIKNSQLHSKDENTETTLPSNSHTNNSNNNLFNYQFNMENLVADHSKNGICSSPIVERTPYNKNVDRKFSVCCSEDSAITLINDISDLNFATNNNNNVLLNGLQAQSFKPTIGNILGFELDNKISITSQDFKSFWTDNSCDVIDTPKKRKIATTLSNKRNKPASNVFTLQSPIQFSP